jgi:membrane protein implicated in regulation of membrane protease activity
MDDPQNWMWVWLTAAFVLGIGEMATAGSFFLAPFAVGAVAGTVLAVFGAPILLQWIVVLAVSAGTFLALRPLARRLDRDAPTQGIGARRLIGERAVVIDAIPAGGELGLVRVHREEWRAESVDGAPVAAGASVRIVDVRGTRVVVFPAELPAPPPVD